MLIFIYFQFATAYEKGAKRIIGNKRRRRRRHWRRRRRQQMG